MKKPLLIAIGILLAGGGATWTWADKAKREAPPVRDVPATEQRITVRAKPRIVEEEGAHWLILPMPEGEPAKVYYDAGPLPDHELVFTIWQSPRVYGRSAEGEDYTVTESVLDSIKHGDAVLFDASICPVHQARMVRQTVEIHYGLLAMDPEAWKSFSGGPGWVGGGCVIMEGAPSKEWGYACAHCVQAYAKWSGERQKRWEQRRAQEAKGKAP